jgi:hypothetical protein
LRPPSSSWTSRCLEDVVVAAVAPPTNGAAAMPGRWGWDIPFLWHGKAAKNWKDDGMAAKFGGCGEMGQLDS